METGGPSTILIVLGIFLAANAILISTAIGLARWWRQKSKETLGELEEQVHGFDAQLGQLERFLKDYARIKQDPYATLLKHLNEETEALRSQVENLDKACSEFDEETRTAGPNRLQEIINTPYTWMRRYRQTGQLRQEAQAIGEQLTAAGEHMEHINQLPWDLALQSRQMEKDLAELTQTAQALQSKGVRGNAFQAVLVQIPLMQRNLEQIPDEFISADQQALLAWAKIDTTVRVFEVLNRTRPAVGRHLPQVKEWNAAFDKANKEYAELKQAGAALRQAMANPPEGLLLSTLNERLDQIAQTAGDLGQRLAQPEVEDLKPLAREVTQLRRVIQDTEQQMNRARQQVGELGRGLSDLQLGLEKLAADAAELERKETFPMVWDTSNTLLNDLRKRLQALGSPQQPRTPEQISQHLKEVEQLRAGHQTHAATLPKIAEQHRALIALLDSADLKEGSVWLRKTREMLTQASIYDPRNWEKKDSIQTLPVEIEELSRLHESLVPSNRAAPIQESGLEQRLKETQQLADQYKGMRPRVESVRARLEKIQALEKEGKDRLTDSYTALERILLLAEGNDLLDQIATDEIERLIEEIRLLSNDLNAQGQGEVEKKLQKIHTLADKINRALNGWLGQLNVAIAEQGKQMSAELAQLDAIALLDDPPVMDARDLLVHEDYTSAMQSSRGTPAQEGPAGQGGRLRGVAAKVVERGAMLQRHPLLDNLEVTAEMKRKNDFWQTLTAMHQALDAKVGSLLASYDDLAQARSGAQEALAELNKSIPSKATWPPSNQTALSEAQLLRPIDEKWDALKKQPRHVEQAILDLGRLTQQYQTAAERAHQVLERVAQDEDRVLELEDKISGLKQQWQSQAQTDPGNPVMREGVRQLISDADSRTAYIKQQTMRGALSYEQVIQSLQLLYDELFSARVSVDAQNDIGLTHATNGKRTMNPR